MAQYNTISTLFLKFNSQLHHITKYVLRIPVDILLINERNTYFVSLINLILLDVSLLQPELLICKTGKLSYNQKLYYAKVIEKS